MAAHDTVTVEYNPNKFVLSMIETLSNKIQDVQEELKGYSADDIHEYEQWVMILNEPLIEIEDESGFIHVSPTSVKEKAEDMFCLLDSLHKSITKYKSTQKMTIKDEAINNEINKNEKLQFQMEQLNRQIAYFESEEKRLQGRISSLEKQKEGLLTRLSEVAGLRLCDNNPNIQDLSDTKRPTKLVEAFGELYDNEWTNALGELMQNRQPERKAIDSLTEILKTVFGTCHSIARTQRMAILGGMTLSDSCSESDHEVVPPALKNKMKILQKDSAMDTYPYVKKQVDQRIGRQSLSKDVQEYADRCAELSWLMNVQDPPIMLNFNAASGDPVDKAMFSFFTKSGSVVDFIVWPAAMYENETIFRKGVLQAK